MTTTDNILGHYFELFSDVKKSCKKQKALNKKILICLAHPDDESINSGLALRLKNQHNCEVDVIPFSFGSNKDQWSRRERELKKACRILGFNLIYNPSDLSKLDLKKLSQLSKKKYDLIITHHPKDNHPSHKKCSKLVSKYFANNKIAFCEYWSQNIKANICIELSQNEIRKSLKALMAHKEELQRNPYHISYPAWLANNYRIISEKEFIGAPKLTMALNFQILGAHSQFYSVDMGLSALF